MQRTNRGEEVNPPDINSAGLFESTLWSSVDVPQGRRQTAFIPQEVNTTACLGVILGCGDRGYIGDQSCRPTLVSPTCAERMAHLCRCCRHESRTDSVLTTNVTPTLVIWVIWARASGRFVLSQLAPSSFRTRTNTPWSLGGNFG